MKYSVSLPTKKKPAVRVKPVKLRVLTECTTAEILTDGGHIEVVPWDLLKFDTIEKTPSLDDIVVPEDEKDETEWKTLSGCFCPHYITAQLQETRREMDAFMETFDIGECFVVNLGEEFGDRSHCWTTICLSCLFPECC